MMILIPRNCTQGNTRQATLPRRCSWENVWLSPPKKERGNCECEGDKDQKESWPSEYYVLAKRTPISGTANPPATIPAIPFRPVLHMRNCLVGYGGHVKITLHRPPDNRLETLTMNVTTWSLNFAPSCLKSMAPARREGLPPSVSYVAQLSRRLIDTCVARPFSSV